MDRRNKNLKYRNEELQKERRGTGKRENDRDGRKEIEKENGKGRIRNKKKERR